MNRSNSDHDPQPLPVSGLEARWTDEGLPLGLRRKLLHEEIEQVRQQAGKAADAIPPPGRARGQASHGRAD